MPWRGVEVCERSGKPLTRLTARGEQEDREAAERHAGSA
jgi:hypothetical protein